MIGPWRGSSAMKEVLLPHFSGFPWFGLCSNGETFNLSTFSGHPVAHLSREIPLFSILWSLSSPNRLRLRTYSFKISVNLDSFTFV